jgi:hypothetical protein
MRWGSSILIALALAVLGAASARAADSGPVIVIPGRLHAPVVINGVDASGAIVEGDFGLNKPDMVAPVVVWGPVGVPVPVWSRGYFPAFGRIPGYGRREIEPPGERGGPGPSFYRFWSSGSDPLPATLEAPQPTPLLIAPQIYPHSQRGGRRP